MKLVWIASLALCATPVIAQTTIYKHVDESGHVTYSNKPMKGATVMELEPITIIQSASRPAASPKACPRILPARRSGNSGLAACGSFTRVDRRGSSRR